MKLKSIFQISAQITARFRLNFSLLYVELYRCRLGLILRHISLRHLRTTVRLCMKGQRKIGSGL